MFRKRRWDWIESIYVWHDNDDDDDDIDHYDNHNDDDDEDHAAADDDDDDNDTVSLGERNKLNQTNFVKCQHD